MLQQEKLLVLEKGMPHKKPKMQQDLLQKEGDLRQERRRLEEKLQQDEELLLEEKLQQDEELLLEEEPQQEDLLQEDDVKTRLLFFPKNILSCNL